MGNNSFVPVLGRGTAVFALNGKRVLVRNVLHVPSLVILLYSLRTHVTQRGCGFIGTEDSGFLVYFPTFVLSVDMAVDSHLSFETLGRSALLYTLDYVQPRCPPTLYPSEVVPALSTAAPSPASRVVIEDDDASASPALMPVDSPTSPSVIDMQHLSSTIQSLMDAVQRFTSSLPPAPLPTSPLVVDPPIAPPSLVDADALPSPRLLSTMSFDDILHLVHHPDTSFPSVRPCDTSNASVKRRIGRRRNSTAPWAVANFEITSISFKSAVMRVG